MEKKRSRDSLVGRGPLEGPGWIHAEAFRCGASSWETLYWDYKIHELDEVCEVESRSLILQQEETQRRFMKMDQMKGMIARLSEMKERLYGSDDFNPDEMISLDEALHAAKHRLGR